MHHRERERERERQRQRQRETDVQAVRTRKREVSAAEIIESESYLEDMVGHTKTVLALALSRSFALSLW